MSAQELAAQIGERLLETHGEILEALPRSTRVSLGLGVYHAAVQCLSRAPTPPPKDREARRLEIAQIIEPQAWEPGVGFKWRYRDALACQAKALAKADLIMAGEVDNG